MWKFHLLLRRGL